MQDATCRLENCDNNAYGRQVCSKHRSRLMRTGSYELNPETAPGPRLEADQSWLESIEVPHGSVAVPVVLPKGRGFTYAVVELDDHAAVKPYRWRLRNGYAARQIWNGGRCTPIYMHRWLMDTPDGMDTDHINRNKLDNRRANLRVADRSTNNFNSFLNRANTSGHKGVTFFKATGRWRAQIKHLGKCYHLGYFATKEEAIAARLTAEYHHLGRLISDDVGTLR